MAGQKLLIVEKIPDLQESHQQLLALLVRQFGLNAYTARQHLLGRGLALFARGTGGKLDKIAGLLERAGVRRWLLEPNPPRFAPARVRALEIGEDAVTFQTQKGAVAIPRGATVLAVLADLSGEVIEKSVRRLLAQNAYRGADHLTQIDDDELYKTVLQGTPALDLYLLDSERQPTSAVRIFAGRFDPKGLGARNTLSATGNIDQLVRLVRETADTFRLNLDFGLAQLPGCRLKTAAESSEAARENLTSLTRYGWLAADLWAHDKTAQEPGGETPAGLLAGALLAEAAADEPPETVSAAAAPPKPGLPAPPDPAAGLAPFQRRLLAQIAAAGCGALFFAFGGKHVGLEGALLFGLRTGLIPGILSAALFWGGFHYLRLKRRVENTPTSKVRSMAMGMVEVHGRAIRQYALVSPMSQMPCVYYRLRKYRRDRNSSWRLCSESSSGHVPFQLEDETGRVTVNPQGAWVRARNSQHGAPGGLSSSGMFDNEKWVEEAIPEGTSLYVLGFARPRRKPHRPLRERTIEALRELKLNRAQLHRYDADGDGRISHEEWETARSDVERQVLHQSLAEKRERVRQEEHIEIGRPDARSLPFLIAETASESHLTRKYGLFTVPLFVAALGTALWALVKILQLTGTT